MVSFSHSNLWRIVSIKLLYGLVHDKMDYELFEKKKHWEVDR